MINHETLSGYFTYACNGLGYSRKELEQKLIEDKQFALHLIHKIAREQEFDKKTGIQETLSYHTVYGELLKDKKWNIKDAWKEYGENIVDSNLESDLTKDNYADSYLNSSSKNKDVPQMGKPPKKESISRILRF